MTPAELAAKWRCYTGPEDVVELEADARAVRLAALREAARAVCRHCHEGLPICYYGGIIEHVILPHGCRVACDAVPIQMLMEKEAANVRTQ